MRIQKIILKFHVLLMVLVFVTSITPRKYFHDLVADHIDESQLNRNSDFSVHQAGWNCHFNQLVAESPFVDIPATITSHLSKDFPLHNTAYYSQQAYRPVKAKDNRGPPAFMV